MARSEAPRARKSGFRALQRLASSAERVGGPDQQRDHHRGADQTPHCDGGMGRRVIRRLLCPLPVGWVVAGGDMLLAPGITRRLIEELVQRPVDGTRDSRLHVA